MSKYSWGVDGFGSFVICHKNYVDFNRFRYGIVCPVFGADRWELIDILEAQDEELK